ncbi:MAG: ribosome silencing factor [Bacteroidales bacterium]|nr:ribosome silencing factor [Bacteroidales bacterium]
MVQSNILINNIIEGILDKKGREIVSLNLENIHHAICDNFIICHGDSNTQVSAIADNIEKKVKENLNIRVNHREGLQNAHWVILDYANIIVHVFLEEYRHYYNLEELWGDAVILKIEESFN